MMRTLLTWMRKSFLSAVFPVDYNVDIHKLLGHAVFFFSIVHSAAHLLNYASLAATVPFSNLFATEAGLTGVILLSAFGIMWVFAQDSIRRRGRFEAFYVTHSLYFVFFVVLLAHAPPTSRHGPSFPSRPTASRSTSRAITSATSPLSARRSRSLRESARLRIRRPERFAFQPGDYLFLKVPKVSRFEWHPFTISSSPEEKKDISVHVRGLGNWTRALYDLVQGLPKDDPYLPVEIRGPFGAPSTRIFRSQCAVLIGAGIGVTPFASILRSILDRKEKGEELTLQKVYFFWLNRDRRSFEWFTDMLAEIEKAGMGSFIELNMEDPAGPRAGGTGPGGIARKSASAHHGRRGARGRLQGFEIRPTG